MRVFYLLFISLVIAQGAIAQTNFYLKTSPNDDPTSVANWGTNLDGTGTAPTNFTTANQTFVIQAGQSITVPTAWTVSGSNAKILVQSGGTLQADAATTVPNFEVADGATYIHNNDSDIPGSTTGVFGASSQVTVTGVTTNPFSFRTRDYGNITWNCASQVVNVNFTGTLRTIKGNFVIQNTNSQALAFVNTGTPSITVDIEGNLSIGLGTRLQFGNNNGTFVLLNIKGNLSNAGTLAGNLTGINTGTIRFNGTSPQTLSNTGTITGTQINWEVASGATLTLANNLALSSGRDFTVNGTLDCGTNVLSGTGSLFNLNAGATLITKQASGVSGAITVTGTKTYDNTANFTFNGTSPQTANLANTTVSTLTIDNASGVSLNTDAAVTNLTLNSGSLNVASGQNLTVSGTGNLSGNQITGAGDFTLNFGANLETSHPSGVLGAVVVSGTKFFDSSAGYIFSGSGTQNAGLTGILNAFSITLHKTLPSDVVSLDADVTLTGTLTLQSGVFNIANRALSFQAADVPITRTANGVLSTSNTSTLNFGNTGTPSGASFTLPDGLFNANPAELSALNIVRTNNLSLGNESLQIQTSLSVGGASTGGDLNLNGQNITLLSGASFTEDRTNNAIVTDATAAGESSPGGYLEIPTPGSVNTITAVADVFTSGTEINGSGIYFGLLSGGSVSFVGGIIHRYHYRGAGKGNPVLYQINGSASQTILGIEFPSQGQIAGIDKVYRYDGTQWTPVDATVIGQRIYTNSAIPGFSSYTVGSSSTGLPIRLVRLEAAAKDARTVMLTWQTATETNNKGFGVERSIDGSTFTEVGFVDGAGNTLTGRSYTFWDNAFTGFAYYRLRQVDYDGTTTYSPLVEANHAGALHIFPNPTTEAIAVRGAANDALLRVSISDMAGRVLGEWRGNEAAINQTLDTHFRRLPAGTYLVTFNGKASRVIKQ